MIVFDKNGLKIVKFALEFLCANLARIDDDDPDDIKYLAELGCNEEMLEDLIDVCEQELDRYESPPTPESIIESAMQDRGPTIADLLDDEDNAE